MIEFIRNHYYEVLYEALFLIITGISLFAAVMIWAFLKRWYSKAKIRRHGKDFKKAVEYIREKGKEMNKTQRFFQGQTGIIVDKNMILGYVLPSVVVCIVFFVLGRHMEGKATEVMDRIQRYALIISITAILVGLCHSIYGLIKYARILPFVFFALISAWYIWLAISVFG